MADIINVGIVGYGNIGRGVERALAANADTRLAAVFTRRDPGSLSIATGGAEVALASDAERYRGKIDALVLCGGSASDLPEQGPYFAARFNTVDSFDTHAKVREYHADMNNAARDTVAVVGAGWDPGLFSLERLIASAVLPDGATHTFWGPGVSQGHSFAIRRVEGVRNAVQYTVPKDAAVKAARSGRNSGLGVRDKHLRDCYVVAEPGADRARIERDIKAIPHYFDGYDTDVHFISEDELREKHSKMPHGGFVIRSGRTGGCPGGGADTRVGGANEQIIEYSLKLNSNPEFTGSVLVAYARAAVRMAREGRRGALTVFDIPPAYLLGAEARDTLFDLF